MFHRLFVVNNIKGNNRADSITVQQMVKNNEKNKIVRGIQNVFADMFVPSHPFLRTDGIPNKLFPLILAARLNSLKPSINIPLEQILFLCVFGKR